MRLRVVTKSGSTYLFDQEAMTYTRTNHNDYRGEQTSGKLVVWPAVVVGERLIFQVENNDGYWDNSMDRFNVQSTLLSTQVLSAEILDD